MKVAEFGIVKWFKDVNGFRWTDTKEYNSKKGFLKCPNCPTDKSNIEDKYIIEHKIINETINCKVTLYDWTCRTCMQSLKFEDFNKVTQNFLINIYKRDLETAASFTVNMIRKEKKSKELTGGVGTGFLGFKGGYKIENPSVIHKCGNCKSKDNFSPEDLSKNIFRCKNCGFINIPRA
ncbi:unnamed protein product [marine sediment metagenome]|uniref:Uncharacterized protein n=1 Tax=marine sediment metagenome TaxID=412755 RepID=X1C4H5_9ZZZZ